MNALFLRRLTIYTIVLSFGATNLCLASPSEPPYQQTSSNKSIYFDIPGQNLKSALLLFGIQAEVSVVIQENLSSGEKSTPLVGYYPIQSGLKVLLGTSHIEYEISSNSQFILIKTNKHRGKQHKEIRTKSSEDLLEEVYVVSARHRQEKIVDIPMSITSFEGIELEERGINNFIKLGEILPNTILKLYRGTNSTMAAYIRGAGLNDPLSGLETSVGIYIDDVYIDRPQGVLLDLFDVERTEILRGPQGTLYGRNTIGGAIKYITNDIPNETSFSTKGSVGSYDQQDLIISFGTPINDRIKISAAVATLNQGGYGKNLHTREAHYNKQVRAVRSRVELYATDNLKLKLSWDKAEDSSNARSGYRLTEAPEYYALQNRYDTLAGVGETQHPIDNNTSTIQGISSALNWKINEITDLKWIYAHREDYSEAPSDLDSDLPVLGDSYGINDDQQKSHELHVRFNADALNLGLGIYHLDSHSVTVRDFVFPATPELRSASEHLVFFLWNTTHTKSLSYFFDFSHSLPNGFEYTLGGRQIHEDKKIDFIRNLFFPDEDIGLVSPYFSGNAQGLLGPTETTDGLTFNARISEEVFTPRISLKKKIDDEILLYTSVSDGYKPGGYAPRSIYFGEEERPEFEAEFSRSIEIGLKRENTGSFRYIYLTGFVNYIKNKQILIAVPSSNIVTGWRSETTNAQRSRIAGFESELAYRWNNSTETQLSLGWLSAKHTKFTDKNGRDLTDTVKFESTPNVTAGLNQDFFQNFYNGKLRYNFSWNYQSKVTFFAMPSKDVDQGGYSLLNASLSWTSNSRMYSFGLHINNITNKKYFSSAFNGGPQVDNILTEGRNLVFWGDPRTWTISLKYSI